MRSHEVLMARRVRQERELLGRAHVLNRHAAGMLLLGRSSCGMASKADALARQVAKQRQVAHFQSQNEWWLSSYSTATSL